MSVAAMHFYWEHSELDSHELLTMLALADNATEDTGECYPGIKTIAKKIRKSTRTARRILSSLEEKGELIVAPNHGVKTSSGHTNRYYLVEYMKSKDIKIPSIDALKEGRDAMKIQGAKSGRSGKQTRWGDTDDSPRGDTDDSPRGDTDDSPLNQGVTPVSGQGVTPVSGQGVTPVSAKPSVEPSVEPSVISSASAEGTPDTSDSVCSVADDNTKGPTEQQQYFGALCWLVGWDHKTLTKDQTGQVAQAMGKLKSAGYTIDDLRNFWRQVWVQDWRWTKLVDGKPMHQHPTLSQIRSEIGKLKQDDSEFNGFFTEGLSQTANSIATTTGMVMHFAGDQP